MTLLSVLVPTVQARLHRQFPLAIDVLHRQAIGRPVEILGLYDNKARSLGAKRNALMDIAAGKYLAFVDDDDRVAGDYVDSVLSALESNPDCVTFDVEARVDGGPPKLCRYGKTLRYEETATTWTGKPAHTHVWRAELARSVRFPDVTFGEDRDWASRAWRRIETEIRIPRVLYFYDMSTSTSETR